MNYYFLRQDLFNATNTIEIAGHTDVTANFNWLDGEPFTTPLPKETLLLDPEYGTLFPDFFDTTIPVMSQRLLEALQLLHVNIEAYPLILKNKKDNTENLDYFAVNLIGVADAIDVNKTVAERLRFGKPYYNSAIYIDPKLTNGLSAFRLIGGPSFIVVNELVASKIAEYKFRDVLLQPTIDYDGA